MIFLSQSAVSFIVLTQNFISLFILSQISTIFYPSWLNKGASPWTNW